MRVEAIDQVHEDISRNGAVKTKAEPLHTYLASLKIEPGIRLLRTAAAVVITWKPRGSCRGGGGVGEQKG